ncbi:Krr1-domain-containing protein [Pseudovirgaria hyperparasitica]|uniref:Krr1-domain-containing protein n=1 Tax=Pseudovirgaria hyperparasitica TaxID=470096 RepID=A0A6A6W4N5_9PEZI|nr:Krr1-domain-containing protein [Pseudovirgaria hyperparasitica]KAF2757888.1 Krr1-domain-containing protein [Pseudovirgaria hyperparasitica]
MGKRDHTEFVAEDRTAKRARILDDDSSAESGDEDQNPSNGFSINKEYAARFEHNKKREEKQRLEEKYGPVEADSDDESSSEDDDEGELINENVDNDILATIQAIKAKDPKIYDTNAHFFSEEIVVPKQPNGGKKEKPMHLQDYHRKNLLEGKFDQDPEEEDTPKTYAQEQQQLKDDIVKQMHAAGEEGNEESEGDEGFLVRKSKPEPTMSAPKRIDTKLDVKEADKDPETFLSNFLASNAWRTTSPSRFQPFDSDDDEELERADKFEEAYNRRFEDPKKSNVTLQSHSRDIIAKYSVRREDLSGRQKARQAERARKDAEKLERDEEKSRLKKLKADEMERKVRQIRQSAGAHGKAFEIEQWADVLDADFDDKQWEEEMQRRFGDEYYEADDLDGSANEQETSSKKKKKAKKPTWDDDIDIKDIVPDFTDDEPVDVAEELDEEAGKAATSKKKHSKKERMKEKEEAKRSARRDRRIIENLVEQNFDARATSSKTNKPTSFRYRETSPKNFGLTARDILLASDADLNQFAGLKKLHAFRDTEKKQKDKKYLSKKARLRQWRKDTFGTEDEPSGGFEQLFNKNSGSSNSVPEKTKVKKLDGEDTAGVDGKKKKKRSRKSKTATAETEA